MRKIQVRMKEQDLTLKEWRKNVLYPHMSKKGSLLKNQIRRLRVTDLLLI